MSLRSDSDQMDYEALRFGHPWIINDPVPPFVDVIQAFAKAVGDLCRVGLVDVRHLGPGRIAA